MLIQSILMIHEQSIIVRALEKAKKFTGNWQKFPSFVWHDRPQDAEKFAHVGLGMSRDAEVEIQSNHRIAKGILENVDPEQENWSEEHQGHFAVGWIELFSIRCLDPKTGEPTPAWIEWCNIQEKLDNYPILDEGDVSELECELGLHNGCEECGESECSCE
jgi:hypothetical protein